MCCGFVVKVPRGRGLASEAKKLTGEDRNFSFGDQRPLPRAFHTKARSHFTITAPLGQLGLLLRRRLKTGGVVYHGCWVLRYFYVREKQIKIPAN
jgi:hypothetical protein